MATTYYNELGKSPRAPEAACGRAVTRNPPTDTPPRCSEEHRVTRGNQVVLKPSETARRLAICVTTLRRLTDRGKLETVRLGRAVRFRTSDVQRIQQEGVRR